MLTHFVGLLNVICSCELSLRVVEEQSLVSLACFAAMHWCCSLRVIGAWPGDCCPAAADFVEICLSSRVVNSFGKSIKVLLVVIACG